MPIACSSPVGNTRIFKGFLEFFQYVFSNVIIGC